MEVNENTDEGEQHAAKHTHLHAELLGRQSDPNGESRRIGIRDNGVRDDSHELRSDGSAEIAARCHHRIDKYAALGESVRGDDQITRPKHGNAKARAGASQQSDQRNVAYRRGEIAERSADGAKGKNPADIFADLGIERASQAQHDGKQSHAEKVAPKLRDIQRLLQIAGAPLRHRAFRRTAEEDCGNAEPNAPVTEQAERARGLLGRFHRGNLCPGKEERRDEGDECEAEREELPILSSRQKQEDRADRNHENNAPGVDRMQLAHFPIGIIRRNGGDHGTDQNLAQTARRGKDHRTDHKAEIDRIRSKKGPDRIDEKAANGNQRNGFDGFRYIEFMRKEGEDQVDDQLRHEIDQNEKTQQGIRNAVQRTERQKKHGGQISHDGHRYVRAVASVF